MASIYTTALRLASAKLPILTEFITRSTPPRLGNISDSSLISPGERLRLRIAAKDGVSAAGGVGSGEVVVGGGGEGERNEGLLEGGAAEVGLPGVNLAGVEGEMSGMKIGQDARV